METKTRPVTSREGIAGSQVMMAHGQRIIIGLARRPAKGQDSQDAKAQAGKLMRYTSWRETKGASKERLPGLIFGDLV